MLALDGMIKGNSENPAVRIIPTKLKQEAKNAQPICCVYAKRVAASAPNMPIISAKIVWDSVNESVQNSVSG